LGGEGGGGGGKEEDDGEEEGEAKKWEHEKGIPEVKHVVILTDCNISRTSIRLLFDLGIARKCFKPVIYCTLSTIALGALSP
jgi:hypothetical protein